MTRPHARRNSWSKKKFGFALVFWLAVSFFAPVLLEESFGDPVREASHEVTMRISFIPFNAETLLGITMRNIEEAGFYKIWFIHESPLTPQEHPFIPKLRQMFLAKKATEEVDDSFIRLKVELPSDTFYVDRNGRVLRSNTGEKYKLSKKQMQDIENTIEHFSGIVDINASKRITAPK